MKQQYHILSEDSSRTLTPRFEQYALLVIKRQCLNDDLDLPFCQVARLQLQVYEAIARHGTSNPRFQGALSQLNAELVDITKVTNRPEQLALM